MTFEEFSDKYEEYLLKLTSKRNFPQWFNLQPKTQGSRNITIDTWNHVITLLGYIASDDHTSIELFDDIVKVLNTLKERLNDSLNTISTELVTERLERTIADTQLQNNIDAEASTRQNSDTVIGQRITDEISAREAGDTAVNNRLTTELSSLETRLEEALQSYLSTAQAADEEIRRSAVGIPTYNETTGKITFETLSGSSTPTTIDLIMMSMLTNVRFDEDRNEIVFTFREHDGAERPIRVPLDNFTLPAWTTSINTTDPDKLSVPPTTQAVKNAIDSINTAMLSTSDVQQMIDTSLGVIENGSY